MTYRLGLAALTVLELDPAEQISCAATTGYDWVSVRLVPATPTEPRRDTAGDTALIRETRRRGDDLGIPILDVETLRLRPDSDVRRDFEIHLATGAQLGARTVVVAGLDPDRSRLVANLRELGDLARSYSLTVTVEFMPWTAVPDLRDTAALLTSVDHPGTGLVIDSLHFDRSDSRPEDIDGLPRRWLRTVHLCDGPAQKPTTTEGLIQQARHARAIPGRGGIDVLAPLRRLPPDILIALEVPLRTAAPRPAVVRAAEVLAGTRALLDGASWPEVNLTTDTTGAH
jgi:sugar phosphate isomerase/epimerase